MMGRRRPRLVGTLASLLVLAGMATAASAQAAKPRIVPGRDPGGPAVALISTGIDYTVPEIAVRLARDGEGDILGLDLVDGDNRPYAPAGQSRHPDWSDGTAAARLLAAEGVRIVPIRVDPDDPLSIARGLAFVAQTPARVAVAPVAGDDPGRFALFAKVAEQLPNVLVVVPARHVAAAAGRPTPLPARLGLSNMLAVLSEAEAAQDAGGDPAMIVPAGHVQPTVAPTGHAAADAAAVAAGVIGVCGPAWSASVLAVDLKRAVLEQARRGAAASRPILQRCAARSRTGP